MKICAIKVTEIEDCATINDFYSIKVTVKLPPFVSTQNRFYMTRILGKCTNNYRAYFKKHVCSFFKTTNFDYTRQWNK